MRREELLAFLRSHRYAVQASASAEHGAQAAVVGIAVLDSFSLVFDTLSSTRKAANLARDARIAFVFGSLSDDAQRTLQYEGTARIPTGDELEDARAHYFRVFPDGRNRLEWPGLVHYLVEPRWLRYSDFSGEIPFTGSSRRVNWPSFRSPTSTLRGAIAPFPTSRVSRDSSIS